jgi:hypothetical protein
LPPVTHHKYAVHHVVGRIRHRLHHKYVHAGPTGGGAPNPYGCEKHAVVGPGNGKNAALPTTPFPSAPVSKLAAVGGGLVGFGGLGGLIGGFSGGGKHVVTGGGGGTTTGGGGGGGNPGTPQCTVTTDPTCSGGTTPSVPVPEPASIAMFIVAVGAAFLARYMFARRGAADGVMSS